VTSEVDKVSVQLGHNMNVLSIIYTYTGLRLLVVCMVSGDWSAFSAKCPPPTDCKC